MEKSISRNKGIPAVCFPESLPELGGKLLIKVAAEDGVESRID